MKKKKSIVIAVIAVLGVAWGGWWLAGSFYLREHEAIRREVSDLTRRMNGFDAASKGLRADRKALLGFAPTMLGGETAVVEHRLRTMLSELAEREGLREVVVSHGKPSRAENPARARGSGVNRTLRRALSGQTDFSIIRARVQGVGSFEQTLRTLAAVRGQPWIHRVEGFTISPRGKDRAEFVLKVDLSTMFAPDLVKPDSRPPSLESPDPAASKRVAALVERDPFHLAPPPTPAPPAPAVVLSNTPAPAPSLLGKWRVTGITETIREGGRAVEVLLARTDTGELKTMHPGDALLGATLENASGESAYFTLGDRRVVVRTGQTLAEATPDESVHSDHPNG